MTMGKLLRIMAFVAGAFGAAKEAMELAMRSDLQVTETHMYAAAFIAMMTYALKFPGDLTKSEAEDLERRVKRESSRPPPMPPGDEP